MSLENFSHVQIRWQLYVSYFLCTDAGKTKQKRRRRKRMRGDSQQSADSSHVSTAERQQTVRFDASFRFQPEPGDKYRLQTVSVVHYRHLVTYFRYSALYKCTYYYYYMFVWSILWHISLAVTTGRCAEPNSQNFQGWLWVWLSRVCWQQMLQRRWNAMSTITLF